MAHSGGEAEFEAFVGRYRHPQTPQEEVRYLYALAGFPQAALSERAFEMAMTEVRTQNAPFLVQLLLSNRDNGAATWSRVSDSWDGLVERFPSQTVPRMLEGAKLLCRDAALAARVQSFVAEHPVRSGQRTVAAGPRASAGERGTLEARLPRPQEWCLRPGSLGSTATESQGGAHD